MKKAKTPKAKLTIYQFLLPSVKMKSHSPRGVIFERELHAFLMSNYDGYTVTGGNITGYWKKKDGAEECNEHRAYQVAVGRSKGIRQLQRFIAHLGAELGEESVFCIDGGEVKILATS